MSWLQEPFDFDLSLKIIADVLYDFFSRIVDPFFFFYSLIKMTFLVNKKLLCLQDKQNNTWLPVEKFHIYARPCVILYLFSRA